MHHTFGVYLQLVIILATDTMLLLLTDNFSLYWLTIYILQIVAQLFNSISKKLILRKLSIAEAFSEISSELKHTKVIEEKVYTEMQESVAPWYLADATNLWSLYLTVNPF